MKSSCYSLPLKQHIYPANARIQLRRRAPLSPPMATTMAIDRSRQTDASSSRPIRGSAAASPPFVFAPRPSYSSFFSNALKSPVSVRRRQREDTSKTAALMPWAPASSSFATTTSTTASSSVSSFLSSFWVGTASWRVWSGLLAAAALGSWAERNTSWGKELSGPLVATLAGLALASCGVIPAGAAPEYSSVNSRLLPLAVPLLLFTADLRRTVADAGRLLLPFWIGAAATAAATVAAFAVVPLTALEGMSGSVSSSAAAASSSSISVGWRVAAALAARHIGGAVNYVGVCEALSVPASASAAALAADNLVCIAYFAAVFRLAGGIAPEGEGEEEESSSLSTTAASASPTTEDNRGKIITVTDALSALAISALVCSVGGGVAASFFGLSPGASVIPAATALAVALATLCPSLTRPLAPAADAVAAALLQVFFAAVGAAGSVAAVAVSAPALFAFCGIQIFGHLGIVLFAGKIVPDVLRKTLNKIRGGKEGVGEEREGPFALRDLLLASNANVGGPTTAAGMAAAKGWRSSVVPCVLVGTLGYATATFFALALGQGVLRGMR